MLAGLAAAVGGVQLYRRAVRPWMYTWGACADEANAVLPGDELVSTVTPRTTRGVTIDAPLKDVWPWLAQIGEDRAGFYSYDWLERLAGTRIHNAGAVNPDWQDLRVGDTVWLARRYGSTGRQVVAAVEPESYLVLMSEADYDRMSRGEKALGSWAFYLVPDGPRTRLLARGSGGAVGTAAFDIAHFVMEQKMLRGIRDRVQRIRQ
ncbi:MAG: hypothetical protein ACM4D3_09555 [Candidatus Sericytochromatia bacterium]